MLVVGELASLAAGLMAGIGALPLLFIGVASQRLPSATLGFAAGVDALCLGIRIRPAWHRGSDGDAYGGLVRLARILLGVVFVDFLAEALASASIQRVLNRRAKGFEH